MQSRWRSKPLWLAILSLVLFVSKTYFNYELPQVDKLIDLILLVLTLLGIVNNPVNKRGI